MKKKLLTTFCLLALSSLAASEDTDYMQDDDNSSTNQTMQQITPASGPIVKHGIDAFLFADFIYFSTRVDNLLQSQRGISTSADKDNYINNKKVIGQSILSDASQSTDSINHQMSPGFKVGAGLNFCYDGWDTLARYTWLHGKASQKTTNGSDSSSSFNEFSKFSIFTNGTKIGKESSDWALHFNAVDWELGREFFISPHLLLRPVFGLKGSWQAQYYNLYELQLSDTTVFLTPAKTTATTEGSYAILQKQSYWGIGIRPGINTSWEICKNFSIFGDAFVSAMWSYFDNSRKDSSIQKNTNQAENVLSFPETTLTDTVKKIHTITPVLELALGLRYETLCSNDDYRIRLQAGWEEQVWFNHNQFILINTPNSYGNLCLQGLTIEARLDF